MRAEATGEFKQWIEGLSDAVGRRRVLMRVRRLLNGNPGSYRYIGKGVSKLKTDSAPGYRVYYAQGSADLIYLLIGGSKSTQSRDIKLAPAPDQQYSEAQEWNRQSAKPERSL